MTRRAAVETMLDRYGAPVKANGAQGKAVIRPLRMETGSDGTLTGENSGLYYRYTGPAGLRLSAGDSVETADSDFTVRRSGTAAFGGEPLYEWAILRELSDAADREIVLLSPDGSVLARAEGYEAKVLRDGCELRSWGEGTPMEIGEGETGYELSLHGVSPESGTLLSDLGEFLVEIRGKAQKTVYAGCRGKELAETGAAFLPPRRSLLVLAAEKEEGVTVGGKESG